jgi:predicted metal-dependent peptidase
MLGVNALLAIDESGSISMPQAVKFYNEILSINRITGTSLLVTEFDTTCTGPVPIDRYSRDKRRVRNGGTDFRPVFTLADKMKIPVVIIFTDGDGAAPESVNQKVLWILTKGGKKPVQYGECVVFGD